jgi:hypothetical protein
MSTKLSREEAVAAICKLPASLRPTARAWLNRRIMDRYGSASWGSKHPDRAVTPRELRQALKFKKAGMAFRPLERIMHLKPASGNGAQRCVREAACLAKKH